MPKIILFFALVLATTYATAQSSDYRLFKVDLTAGYSRPSATADLSGGFNFALEPKFNITNQIAVGLKFEGAVMAAASADEVSVVVGLQSTSLTGEYYFGTGSIRPFLGTGVGLYRVFAFATDGEDIASGYSDRLLGLAPRAGLQIGHFRLGAEYNLVKDVNYFSIKLGATFGGGRK